MGEAVNDNHSEDIKPLVERLAKVVDREAKRRGYSALQVCGALGAVAGLLTAAEAPESGAIDAIMLGAMGMGFEATVRAGRMRSRGVEA